MKRFIKAVGTGQRLARDLTSAEAAEAFRLILSGQATDAQLGAFLVALRIKGESVDEMISFVNVAREGLRRIEVSKERLLDVGLPYDGKKKTPHVAPLIALIAAGAGARAMLHSDRQVPPKYGFTIEDVLEKMGLDTQASSAAARETLEQTGLAYLSASEMHPAFHSLKRVRVEINLRTFLNNVEKLWNPADASHQLVSVYHGPFLPTIAQSLAADKRNHALVVQGIEGSTDVWPHRPTKGLHVHDGKVTEWAIIPKDLGFGMGGMPAWEALAQPDANAAAIDRTLAGEVGDFQDWALLNAAIWIWLSGVAADVKDGLVAARKSLESGAAAQKLRLWKAIKSSAKIRA